MPTLDYACGIEEFGPVTLAVTETFLRQKEIPERINAQFDIVYQWAKASNVNPAGHNHAIYDRFGPDGMRMRVGFPVSETFADGDRVQCFAFGVVKAAHIRHHGPYSGLAEANAALNAWCESEPIERMPLSWEVYGDWYDDPSKLVTDVYIQIA